jgi:transposase
MEPTGPAWLPIAVFFGARGHAVFRVSSQKAADLRRFLSRHGKSNGIDADTLARLPLVDPHGLAPLQLPAGERAALDRRVRACDRLTMQASEHKVRLKDLIRQLMPLTPLTGDLGQADLAVLEQWADPRALLRLGKTRLSAVIAEASRNHQDAARAEQWLASAEAAVEFYADHPAMAFADLAAEVATEVRLIRAIEAELAVHAAERETAYRWADPGQLARTLPGLGEVGGPVLAAVMGEASRFPTGAHFKSYLGLAPRASQTGDTDRKGQPMSKAGSRLLRSTLVRAADHARKQDPQLAKVYYVQMVERGAGHLKALCVVAGRMAERAWAVMHRRMPYVICDTTGTPVTPSKPGRSSSRIGRSPLTCAPADAPARPRRRGRSLSKSSPDMTGQAHEAPTNEATFPTPDRRRATRARQGHVHGAAPTATSAAKGQPDEPHTGAGLPAAPTHHRRRRPVQRRPGPRHRRRPDPLRLPSHHRWRGPNPPAPSPVWLHLPAGQRR